MKKLRVIVGLGLLASCEVPITKECKIDQRECRKLSSEINQKPMIEDLLLEPYLGYRSTSGLSTINGSNKYTSVFTEMNGENKYAIGLPIPFQYPLQVDFFSEVWHLVYADSNRITLLKGQNEKRVPVSVSFADIFVSVNTENYQVNNCREIKSTGISVAKTRYETIPAYPDLPSLSFDLISQTDGSKIVDSIGVRIPYWAEIEKDGVKSRALFNKPETGYSGGFINISEVTSRVDIKDGMVYINDQKVEGWTSKIITRFGNRVSEINIEFPANSSVEYCDQ